MASLTDEDLLLKVVLLGASGVGKSQLVNMYAGTGVFKPELGPTVGVDFSTKLIRAEDGSRIKAQIWDTAGQERYRAITSAYYRSSQGALLVFDITSKSSFLDTKRWLAELRQHSGNSAVVMLVGNKLDLEADRQVSVDEALAFAEAENLAYVETSAKDDAGIDEAFDSVLKEIYRLRREASPKSNRSSGSSVSMPAVGKCSPRSGTEVVSLATRKSREKQEASQNGKKSKPCCA